mmetsp:Transcript_15865/g.39246  ORF Transcript_15865/g.39246 Transcript_15865/m.39246 type:complete len:228 (-) Transcript_15865:2396-3079(-)
MGPLAGAVDHEARTRHAHDIACEEVNQCINKSEEVGDDHVHVDYLTIGFPPFLQTHAHGQSFFTPPPVVVFVAAAPGGGPPPLFAFAAPGGDFCTDCIFSSWTEARSPCVPPPCPPSPSFIMNPRFFPSASFRFWIAYFFSQIKIFAMSISSTSWFSSSLAWMILNILFTPARSIPAALQTSPRLSRNSPVDTDPSPFLSSTELSQPSSRSSSKSPPVSSRSSITNT